MPKRLDAAQEVRRTMLCRAILLAVLTGLFLSSGEGIRLLPFGGGGPGAAATLPQALSAAKGSNELRHAKSLKTPSVRKSFSSDPICAAAPPAAAEYRSRFAAARELPMRMPVLSPNVPALAQICVRGPPAMQQPSI